MKASKDAMKGKRRLLWDNRETRWKLQKSNQTHCSSRNVWRMSFQCNL